jgi:D-alanyl-D-alanine dipeptidase
VTPYAVPSYPVTAGKLAGTEEWAKQAAAHSGGALWNNGTWVNRDVRGKPGQVSNHARGVALDLSFRYYPHQQKGASDGRAKSLAFMRQALDAWQVLGIALVIDYWPQPYGRSWRCDRTTWRKATAPTFTGAPGGDWWHVELALDLAQDPAKVRDAFRQVFTTA